MSTPTPTTSSPSSTTISASPTATGFVLYKYHLNRPLACVSIALFGLWTLIVTVEVLWKYIRTIKLFKSSPSYVQHRKQIQKTLASVCFGIYIPLILGGLLEVGGYISRLSSASDRLALSPFIAQSVLILVAPGMMSATVYMLFHKMIEFLNCPENSGVGVFIKDTLMVKIFVSGDVISFFLQAAGGGIMSQKDTLHTGEVIIIVGLFVQLVSFGIFIFVQLNFTLRYKKFSENYFYLQVDNKWKYLNYSLYSASIFILIRSVVRVAEFIQGFNGVISSHEYFLYIFDALAMFLTMVSLSLSFFFIDVGEMYYNHFTITYPEKHGNGDALEETESRNSFAPSVEIPEWKDQTA
ncbi:Protoporphyrin uptake protein 1 [Hanseniaspora osmophila]|uniref:Protoporphyrin uptake protein 1 n=1 Tax=Hanseniaspora osmophila TaxID=56408 RepID=A0A1E5RN46_9ASCO|nr:Protoporphyrin uptake protein 1 [Hanseniaspora osmophila]